MSFNSIINEVVKILEQDLFAPATPEEVAKRQAEYAAVKRKEAMKQQAEKRAVYAAIPYTYKEITTLPAYKKIMDLGRVQDLTTDLLKTRKTLVFRLRIGPGRLRSKDYIVQADGVIRVPNAGQPWNQAGYSRYFHSLRDKGKGSANTLEGYNGLLEELYQIMIRKLNKHDIEVNVSEDIFKPASPEEVDKRREEFLKSETYEDKVKRLGQEATRDFSRMKLVPTGKEIVDVVAYTIEDDSGYMDDAGYMKIARILGIDLEVTESRLNEDDIFKAPSPDEVRQRRMSPLNIAGRCPNCGASEDQIEELEGGQEPGFYSYQCQNCRHRWDVGV